jgi:hypothetical protein
MGEPSSFADFVRRMQITQALDCVMRALGLEEDQGDA